MKIFEDKERIDFEFAKHSDTTYNFYDRTARPEFARNRDMINKWFESYPSSEQPELKSRFKKSFGSAFFELFIYQLFTKQGFKLTPHPKLTHTSKTPDFLAEKEGTSFYIEAKEVNEASESEVSLERKIDAIYDAISEIEVSDFWLSITNFEIKGERQPSGKKIKKLIEKQISLYTPKIISEDASQHDRYDIEHINIEDSDVKFTARLLPKSSELIGKAPTIGTYPIRHFWGGPENSIRSAIHKKASRYGELDKPYLICLNVFSKTGIDTIGIEAAILGSISYTWSINPDDRDEKWEHAKDGVFLSHSGPKMTRVSGVFVTSIFPSNLHAANHWLFKHPYTKRDLDFTRLGLSFKELKELYWQQSTGCSIQQILDE